ncbi:MAG: inositol 2-dehydrogenase [Synergistaceae bacterium]|nr:inositol 2-dehydrogenase [Synergistaceae bacterium]MBR0076575.1 inositol 2-dehydrogenase [Synergistaceae bacterium]MBR0078972.1 inositol 2-dehydrogenase [Synergistaceae bacterium]MBR0234112.1 inositol 2-dehydrogenase [Synergistaceae bacterium]MBR0252499.1 inositol 2-dehydrogenase [Synergistaceae bacterium]
MSKKLRIGIIGAGRIGKLHANNLFSRVPGAELAAISDVYEPAAKELAEKLGVPVYTSDYHKILEDPSIDAVFICSSTDTHSPVSIDAAKAGKHIFCEKPIDHDLDKIRAVLEEVKKAGVKYQVGFNRRFDRNFKHVHEVVKSGGIGDVQIVKVTSRDPEAPPISYVKVSGGIFVDMTIHDFDMVRYLSGSEVEEVSAFGACLVNPEIGKAGDVDTCIITLKFANGALGVIDNSRQAVYGYDQRIEVFGSKGCITADNETPNNTTLYTKEAVTKEKPLWFFLERYNDAFIAEECAFVESCLNGTDTAVGAFDGLQPVLIAIAAKESCEKGGIPVKVMK